MTWGEIEPGQLFLSVHQSLSWNWLLHLWRLGILFGKYPTRNLDITSYLAGFLWLSQLSPVNVCMVLPNGSRHILHSQSRHSSRCPQFSRHSIHQRIQRPLFHTEIINYFVFGKVFHRTLASFCRLKLLLEASGKSVKLSGTTFFLLVGFWLNLCVN
jgi:hypothetical protein